eukprot:CAMPEP_0204511842 /NCGR_PEP_ID=MMETSP0661-20131031/648_1 /ASSEMBLY_ACC=CAM_ASM_000606 /TAXON_ID=109239 /ORGANISM="Alexandrium margalefi, Strain AMGDE01CS-322" /LENGTH=53 /DNA_ID=CAMNT_0051516943 /DNA_START=93 /DNA_END=251 /DNA_ORIENTATION=-
MWCSLGCPLRGKGPLPAMHNAARALGREKAVRGVTPAYSRAGPRARPHACMET